jgi:glycosidase
MHRLIAPLALCALSACATPMANAAPAPAATAPADTAFRARLPQDEVIYFVLPDRFENGDPANDKGGLSGGALQTGFNPAHKGFYQGGDLKGLISRLDYIQGMGVTAIWFAPVFKNKPVQGGKGQESAGYHGYWVNDFTSIDPHFGTNAEFKAFVDAAHGRGMKVYMDIITNHTADVIQYAECPTSSCAYRSVADYPYSRRARNGAAINDGFLGDHVGSADNFARLTDVDWAYSVRVPPAEANVKVPAWLNDPRYYHNRGDSNWRGESTTYGDFVGLDDLMTEHPRVVDGFIEVYGDWIDRFGIDGFRIDTARHVNPEFWQRFVPAMHARAAAKGIPNFHIFGEVYREGVDPGALAVFSRRDGFPALLDFSFQAAVRDMIAGDGATDMVDRLFEGDVLYEGGSAAARGLPTFTGNHDMGRFSGMIKAKRPGISADELLSRVMLGNALLFASRGSPTIYYGDEQGFVSDGNDQDARETMFASKTAVYLDNDLVGTDRTHASAQFDPAHPLYRQIAELARVRAAHPVLRQGDTVLRHAGAEPGLLAFSRKMDGAGEMLVALNTSTREVRQRVRVDAISTNWSRVTGSCKLELVAPGSVELTLAPLGYCLWDASPNG